MNTYIALLRAVNVGGNRIIKMADLRALLTSMGLKNVSTYIQSGNVIFKSREVAPDKLSKIIKENIRKTFGHDVAVVIRTRDQLSSLLDINPFEERNHDSFILYVTFFQSDVSTEKQNDIRNLSNELESYQFKNGELFSLIDKQTEKKVLFSNNYIEKIAGVAGTTRNWITVNRIVELSKASK